MEKLRKDLKDSSIKSKKELSMFLKNIDEPLKFKDGLLMSVMVKEIFPKSADAKLLVNRNIQIFFNKEEDKKEFEENHIINFVNKARVEGFKKKTT